MSPVLVAWGRILVLRLKGQGGFSCIGRRWQRELAPWDSLAGLKAIEQVRQVQCWAAVTAVWKKHWYASKECRL